MNNPIFYFLVFPGFIFTAIIGIVVSWIDRKVTARVQWRKGPPFLQPLYDLVKLSIKETILPAGGSKIVFLLAPLIGFAGIILVSTLTWLAILDPTRGFVGDIIVLIYLLTLPSLSLIFGGFASANRLASQGASREMKLILSYELPFLLAVAVVVINTGYSIKLGEITMNYTLSLSGILALIIAVICQQAKLGLVPFDMAEAETEIMAGAIVEYSGVALLIHKLSRMMMLFVVPMFLVTVFLGGIDFATPGTFLSGVLKYIVLLVVIVLIRNTAPRLRIDQAMKFFWGPVTILAILAVILALTGY